MFRNEANAGPENRVCVTRYTAKNDNVSFTVAFPSRSLPRAAAATAGAVDLAAVISASAVQQPDQADQTAAADRVQRLLGQLALGARCVGSFQLLFRYGDSRFRADPHDLIHGCCAADFLSDFVVKFHTVFSFFIYLMAERVSEALHFLSRGLTVTAAAANHKINEPSADAAEDAAACHAVERRFVQLAVLSRLDRSDLDTIRTSMAENEKKLKTAKKSLRKYGEIKKKINERYYALMLSDKNRFGLEGIDAKSFENIKRTFSAGGSNNPLSTIIWYVNLIQLKHEFNPTAIDFPVVFDSPNNAETDETKKRQIYRYICERITENQLIVSGLGFSGDEILDSFDSVITLTNNKYELLCREDYDANVSLLRELNNK